ncbi:MAG: EamA family transporter [Alphaproteobacteria bacterium]|nr:EamA family transporter [Alphaproteobacteria bacterium]
MPAVALILLSAATHAVVNVLSKRAEDKYAMRLLIGVVSAFFAAPFLILLPLPQGKTVWFLLATALVHAFYELFVVKSYESAAFSAVYPVARGTGPLFTALGAVLLLREHPAIVELAGIVLVCAGVIAIGVSHRKSATAGLGYALATGVTIGCYTLIDASGIRSAADPLTYVLWFFIAYGASVLVTAPALRGASVLLAARRQWKVGIAAAALAMLSYGCALMAFRVGATAPLAALRETSVLFGTALAASFLGEPMTLRRLAAAGAIVAGAIMLQAG